MKIICIKNLYKNLNRNSSGGSPEFLSEDHLKIIVKKGKFYYCKKSLQQSNTFQIYSDEDLFIEMERIWKKVGQRPSRTEWEMFEPKISIAAYKNRFGSWTNACLKFIEFKMGGEILSDNFVRYETVDPLTHEKRDYHHHHYTHLSVRLYGHELDFQQTACDRLFQTRKLFHPQEKIFQ